MYKNNMYMYMVHTIIIIKHIHNMLPMYVHVHVCMYLCMHANTNVSCATHAGHTTITLLRSLPPPHTRSHYTACEYLQLYSMYSSKSP